MAVKIRRGELIDASPAADLWLRAREAAIGAIPPPAHTDEEVRSWFITHVARELELWIAESEHGELLGILVLGGNWIDQLYVDPTNTGRGVGGVLLGVAKRPRPSGLQLWTFASNRGDRRLRGTVPDRRIEGRSGTVPAARTHRRCCGWRCADARSDRRAVSLGEACSGSVLRLRPGVPTPTSGQVFCDQIPGARPQVTIAGAAHFLQEDRGEQIAREILTFLSDDGSR